MISTHNKYQIGQNAKTSGTIYIKQLKNPGASTRVSKTCQVYNQNIG